MCVRVSFRIDVSGLQGGAKTNKHMKLINNSTGFGPHTPKNKNVFPASNKQRWGSNG